MGGEGRLEGPVADKNSGSWRVYVASAGKALQTALGGVALNDAHRGGGSSWAAEMLPLRTKRCRWTQDVATDKEAGGEGWLLACRSRALTN